jgi:hypothetical protein
MQSIECKHRLAASVSLATQAQRNANLTLLIQVLAILGDVNSDQCVTHWLLGLRAG